MGPPPTPQPRANRIMHGPFDTANKTILLIRGGDYRSAYVMHMQLANICILKYKEQPKANLEPIVMVLAEASRMRKVKMSFLALRAIGFEAGHEFFHVK